MRKAAFFFMCFDSCLLLTGCYPALETKARHVVHSGEAAEITGAARGKAYAALDKASIHELARAVGGGDAAVIERLLRDGKAVEVPAGTVVQVTGESFNERQVRIMEGAHQGKTAWVPFEWLKPRAGRP